MTTTETPKEQPQAEGVSRLEKEFSGEVETQETQETPQTTFQDEEKPADVAKPAKEAEVKAEEKPEEKKEEPKELLFEDDSTEAEEDGWKPWFKEFGFEIPEDYSEEKGHEILKAQFEQKALEREQQALQIAEADIVAKYPEELQGQAKMYLDLIKAGKTLDDIQAPLMEVKELKSLSKEALVRWAVEQQPGYTEDMVNAEMERLSATPQLLETQHKIVLTKLDNYEKEYIQEQKKQIDLYNIQAAQLREQRKQKEFGDFKKALDGEKTFMDTKLTESNKEKLAREFQNGYKDSLLNDPKKLVRFMLFDKYGEQALKYVQSRAIEKAALAEAKKKHNIPTNVVSAGGSRATPEQAFESGEARLAEMFNQTGAV